MSLEAFLEWERGQELRWEFDGVSARAMTGGTEAHAAIEVNIVTALATRLRGTPCRVRGGTLKVRIGSRIRYPDAVVTCTAAAPGDDIVPEPVVVFEVPSRRTQRTDTTAKLLEYRSLDSLQRYVLLEQDQVLATVYARGAGGWTVDQPGAGAMLEMPEIGVSVPLSELYEGVALEAGGEEG